MEFLRRFFPEVLHLQADFPGRERDIFMGADGYFKRVRYHRERHPKCVRYMNTMVKSEKAVAAQRLRACKGIFLIFPDGSKGAIHLWPSSRGISQLETNIASHSPQVSFAGVIPVFISSNDRFVAEKWQQAFVAGVSITMDSIELMNFIDLGLDVFYKELGQAFPDLMINPGLSFTNEFIEQCMVELGDHGLRVFDYSRIIDPERQAWFRTKDQETGEYDLRPVEEGLQEINEGLAALNHQLRNRGLIT